MYDFIRIEDIREGMEFVYDSRVQVVVKAEPNILGQIDIWYKPVEFKNIACPATGHLVFDEDKHKNALMVRI